MVYETSVLKAATGPRWDASPGSCSSVNFFRLSSYQWRKIIKYFNGSFLSFKKKNPATQQLWGKGFAWLACLKPTRQLEVNAKSQNKCRSCGLWVSRRQLRSLGLMCDQRNCLFLGASSAFPSPCLHFPPHLSHASGMAPEALCRWVPWDASPVKGMVSCTLRGAGCLHDEASVRGGPLHPCCLAFLGDLGLW